MELNLLDFFNVDNISLNLKSTKKDLCIGEMVELANNCGKVIDKEAFLKSLLDREENGTTGIGKGIAIPHARTDTVSDITISIGISKEGIDYQALDKQKVHILCLVAAPVRQSTKILILIAKLCRFFNSSAFRENLVKAKTKEEVIELFKGKE